ncbi:MAG: divalent-cation tolerance protein CutA [Rhodoglobus sp.]
MEALASITVTAKKPDDLAVIAHALLGERLAACVNIVPGIRSIYAWQGEVVDEGESFALIHTRASLIPEVMRRVSELHPYDVPQVLAFLGAGAQPDYAAWVIASTSAETLDT